MRLEAAGVQTTIVKTNFNFGNGRETHIHYVRGGQAAVYIVEEVHFVQRRGATFLYIYLSKNRRKWFLEIILF